MFQRSLLSFLQTYCIDLPSFDQIQRILKKEEDVSADQLHSLCKSLLLHGNVAYRVALRIDSGEYPAPPFLNSSRNPDSGWRECMSFAIWTCSFSPYYPHVLITPLRISLQNRFLIGEMLAFTLRLICRSALLFARIWRTDLLLPSSYLLFWKVIVKQSPGISSLSDRP